MCVMRRGVSGPVDCRHDAQPVDCRHDALWNPFLNDDSLAESSSTSSDDAAAAAAAAAGAAAPGVLQVIDLTCSTEPEEEEGSEED